MGVYKNNATGLWEWVETINGKQKRGRLKSFTTKKVAQQHLDNYLEEIKDLSNPTNPKFEVVAYKFLEYIEVKNKKSSWLKEKYNIVAHILPFFGNMKIQNITLVDIQRFQKELLQKRIVRLGVESGYKNKTLEIIQHTLKAVLDYAYKNGYIRENPYYQATTVYKREFEHKEEMQILTKDQYEAFMEVIEDVTDRAMYSLLYWTGLRMGELLALNIEDVDLANKEIHVYKNYDHKNKIITTTKTNKDRYVSLPHKSILELNKLFEYYDTQKHIKSVKSALIGLIERPSYTQLRRTKEKYVELANERLLEKGSNIKVPYMTFHEFRHTHVSTLIDLGLNAKDIADRLGHSVEMVNNTYSHLFPKRKDEILNRLNNL